MVNMNNMAEPVKFTFDRAFDGGAKNRYDEEIERIHQENIQAQAASHAQGIEEGRQQALHEIEANTQQILEQIAQAAHALFSQQHQLESNLKQEMVQLAYTIASKLSPALIKTKPLSEVEALIEDCMVTAHKEPRLLVRVSETIAEAVSDRLEDMKVATNFPGDIVLIGEADFGPQDCRVEWPDGGTERKHSDTLKAIENAVQRFVMSDTEMTNQQQAALDEAIQTNGDEAPEDTPDASQM